jgi:uncharacterized membrane protein
LLHRVAVLTIASALLVHRALDAAIVSRAPERARRADWAEVLENTGAFTVLERGM